MRLGAGRRRATALRRSAAGAEKGPGAGDFAGALSSCEAYLRVKPGDANLALLRKMAADGIPPVGFRLAWPIESSGWEMTVGRDDGASYPAQGGPGT